MAITKNKSELSDILEKSALSELPVGYFLKKFLKPRHFWHLKESTGLFIFTHPGTSLRSIKISTIFLAPDGVKETLIGWLTALERYWVGAQPLAHTIERTNSRQICSQFMRQTQFCTHESSSGLNSLNTSPRYSRIKTTRVLCCNSQRFYPMKLWSVKKTESGKLHVATGLCE